MMKCKGIEHEKLAPAIKNIILALMSRDNNAATATEIAHTGKNTLYQHGSRGRAVLPFRTRHKHVRVGSGATSMSLTVLK